MALRSLDVSGLEPCEPLAQTLAALPTLAPGEPLRVLLPREPLPLYALLAERGFRYRGGDPDARPFILLIWHADDAVAAAAAARIEPR